MGLKSCGLQVHGGGSKGVQGVVEGLGQAEV